MKCSADVRCSQIIARLVHDFWARHGDELRQKDSEIDADFISRGLFNTTARISDKVGLHRQYLEQLSQSLLTSLEEDYPQVRPSACQLELQQVLEGEYTRLSLKVPGWLHASNLLQEDIRASFEQGIVKHCDKAKKDVENACALWNVRWIERRRRWYRDPKWLVGIGVSVVIAVFGWFVPRWLQSRDGRDEKPPGAASDSSRQDSNAYSDIDGNQPAPYYNGSFKDYVGKLAALEDRDFERQEFLRSMAGKRVIWRGWVDGVSEYGGATIVGLKASREGLSLDVVGVSFPSSEWRTKLYALHKGDEVEVDAIYNGIPDLIPVLGGLSISLIEAK